MKTVCETLGVARSNIAARATGSLSRARGRPPLPDRELVENIKAIIADMPTYGYRRVHAIQGADITMHLVGFVERQLTRVGGYHSGRRRLLRV